MFGWKPISWIKNRNFTNFFTKCIISQKKIFWKKFFIFFESLGWHLSVLPKKKKKFAKCLDYCNLSEIYEISLLHIENGAYIFYVFMHQSLDWKHIYKATVSWNDFCKIRLINNLQSSINCNWKHIYNATVSWNDICKIRLIHNLQSWNIWGWKHAYNATSMLHQCVICCSSFLKWKMANLWQCGWLN